METLKAVIASPLEELELVKPRHFLATTATINTSFNCADLAVSAFVPDTLVIDDAGAVVKGTYAVGNGTISGLTTLTGAPGTFSRVCAGQTISATAGTGSIAGGTTVTSVSADGSTIVLSTNGTNGTVTDIIVGNASFTLQSKGQMTSRTVVGAGTVTSRTIVGNAGQFRLAKPGMIIINTGGTGTLADNTLITAVSADGTTITLSDAATANGTLLKIEVGDYKANDAFANVQTGQAAVSSGGTGAIAGGATVSAISPDKSTIRLSNTSTAGTIGSITFGPDTVIKFTDERDYASATLSLANAVAQGMVQVGDKITVIANGGSNQEYYNMANSGKEGRATVRAVDPANNRIYFDLPVEPANATAATGTIRVHVPFRKALLVGMKVDGTGNTGIVKAGYVNNIAYQQIRLAASLVVPANGSPFGSTFPLDAGDGAKFELSQLFFQVATANDAIYFILN